MPKTSIYLKDSETCAPHWAQEASEASKLFESPILAFDSKTLNLI